MYLLNCYIKMLSSKEEEIDQLQQRLSAASEPQSGNEGISERGGRTV